MTRDYVLDQGFGEERARLSGMEALWDPGSQSLLDDIGTRFVEHLASDSITVRRIDLREDELPQAEYDLVHSRLVLEHLSGRKQILDRLVATLKPGGWMVMEDYDWTIYGFEDGTRGF